MSGLLFIKINGDFPDMGPAMICNGSRGSDKLVLASANLWLATMPLHKLQHGRIHEVRHLVHGAVTCACTGDAAIQLCTSPCAACCTASLQHCANCQGVAAVQCRAPEATGSMPCTAQPADLLHNGTQQIKRQTAQCTVAT